MATMSPEQLDTFLSETRIAKLATLNGDGSPNVVPVWFEWADGEARVFTSRGSAKVKRLERDPRCAVSVEEGVGIPEAWVTVEGLASIDDEGTWELVERLARSYYEPEKAAATLVELERGRANWVTIRVKPTRIRSSIG
jgi:PPOX class probable F420-dependent enzyme